MLDVDVHHVRIQSILQTGRTSVKKAQYLSSPIVTIMVNRYVSLKNKLSVAKWRAAAKNKGGNHARFVAQLSSNPTTANAQ